MYLCHFRLIKTVFSVTVIKIYPIIPYTDTKIVSLIHLKFNSYYNKNWNNSQDLQIYATIFTLSNEKKKG